MTLFKQIWVSSNPLKASQTCISMPPWHHQRIFKRLQSKLMAQVICLAKIARLWSPCYKNYIWRSIRSFHLIINLLLSYSSLKSEKLWKHWSKLKYVLLLTNLTNYFCNWLLWIWPDYCCVGLQGLKWRKFGHTLAERGKILFAKLKKLVSDFFTNASKKKSLVFYLWRTHRNFVPNMNRFKFATALVSISSTCLMETLKQNLDKLSVLGYVITATVATKLSSD